MRPSPDGSASCTISSNSSAVKVSPNSLATRATSSRQTKPFPSLSNRVKAVSAFAFCRNLEAANLEKVLQVKLSSSSQTCRISSFRMSISKTVRRAILARLTEILPSSSLFAYVSKASLMLSCCPSGTDANGAAFA
jgi:hypothetical protein